MHITNRRSGGAVTEPETTALGSRSEGHPRAGPSRSPRPSPALAHAAGRGLHARCSPRPARRSVPARATGVLAAPPRCLTARLAAATAAALAGDTRVTAAAQTAGRRRWPCMRPEARRLHVCPGAHQHGIELVT
eukprot:363377-Chlamydomonas_euryale.AAC.3